VGRQLRHQLRNSQVSRQCKTALSRRASDTRLAQIADESRYKALRGLPASATIPCTSISEKPCF